MSLLLQGKSGTELGGGCCPLQFWQMHAVRFEEFLKVHRTLTELQTALFKFVEMRESLRIKLPAEPRSGQPWCKLRQTCTTAGVLNRNQLPEGLVTKHGSQITKKQSLVGTPATKRCTTMPCKCGKSATWRGGERPRKFKSPKSPGTGQVPNGWAGKSRQSTCFSLVI